MYICMCCGKDYADRLGKCIACGSSELEDLDEEEGKLLQEQIDRPYEEWSEYEGLSWVVIATHFMRDNFPKAILVSKYGMDNVAS